MLQPTVKYRAKYVFWDAVRRVVVVKEEYDAQKQIDPSRAAQRFIRFDSKHEFKVYLELTRIFGFENVRTQHKLEIIPPTNCYPRGKAWRVDFAILNRRSGSMFTHYVEAKGLFLPEFATTLALLELEDFDAFEKVRIIFPGKIPDKHRVVKALMKTCYAKNLITYKQLCKNTHLL